MVNEISRQPNPEFALAEAAEPIRPWRVEGLSAETIKQQLVRGVRQNYRNTLRRIRAAETVGAIDDEAAANFTDRLKHLFIQERSERELDYVFGGKEPTVEEMRPAFDGLREQAKDDRFVITLELPSNQQYWQLIDGKVNGVIHANIRQPGSRNAKGRFPVVGGEIIKEVSTESGDSVPIEYCDHFHVLDGQLYGTVRPRGWDGHHLDADLDWPVVAGRIVEWVGRNADQAIPIYGAKEFVADRLTGEWSAAVYMSLNPQILQPVIRGRLVERIGPDGPRITSCHQIAIDEAGRFSAVIVGEDHKQHLIVQDEFRDSVVGRPIEQVGVFLVSETGKVSGTFELGGEWVTVCEDEILEHLSGDHFPPSTYELELIDGKLYGYIQTADDPFVPVIRNKPVLELEGKRIMWVNNGEIYPDGTFDFGIVSLQEANRQQPAIVLRSQLITEIEGKRIVSVADTSSFDGTLAGLSGLVQLEGEEKARRYVLGQWEYKQ